MSPRAQRVRFLYPIRAMAEANRRRANCRREGYPDENACGRRAILLADGALELLDLVLQLFHLVFQLRQVA